MKSERRHELQTNYLADHLGTAVQTSRPYAMWVAIGIAAVVVLAIAYGIYTTQSAKANAEAWGDYYFNMGAGDAEVFQQVAEDHPNTAAANWAMQAWADNQLLLGLDQIYTNRKQAETTLEGAIDAYEGIIKSARETELKNRASIGLAQSYEALGKLDEATRYYQQVTSSSQDGFAGLAAQRLAWIKSGEGKSFYDWFASVRSTPEAPPALPGDLSRPPQSPDINFPQKQNPLTLPGTAELPTSGGSSTTPSGSTPPQGSLPSSSAVNIEPSNIEPSSTGTPTAPAKDEAADAVPPADEAPEKATPSADSQTDSTNVPAEPPKF